MIDKESIIKYNKNFKEPKKFNDSEKELEDKEVENEKDKQEKEENKKKREGKLVLLYQKIYTTRKKELI